jgi:hypothetical protein
MQDQPHEPPLVPYRNRNNLAMSPLLAQPLLADEQRFRQIITSQIEAFALW